MPVTPEMRLRILDDPTFRMKALRNGSRNVIMRKAVRAGAKPIRVAVKADAPRKSGALGSSIASRIATSKKTGATYAVIGPRRGEAKQKKGVGPGVRPTQYAHFDEFGTKPHSLSKGDSLFRANRKGSGTQTPGARKHPGASPHPFLRPAFVQTRDAALAAMRKVIIDELAKLLGKKRAKSGGFFSRVFG